MLIILREKKYSMSKLYNHQTASLSEIDLKMIKSVPSGGNWKNIPKSIPSERLNKIRKSGGRTTYYGRLRWDNLLIQSTRTSIDQVMGVLCIQMTKNLKIHNTD